MDPLLGISSYTPIISIGANGAIGPTTSLLAAELSLSSPSLFGSTSSVVQLSGLGQLLSAAATFEDQLLAFKPGTVTSGGGQNFGTDVASFAAEAQNLVDIFNGLQNNVANINVTPSVFGGGISIASGLLQSLNAQAQENYVNGDSVLTNLSQIGIVFQANPNTGAGSLSINLDTLKSAFNSDAAGAFSLLTNAANALRNVGGNFVQQSGGQYSVLSALEQASSDDGSLADVVSDSLLAQAQSGGSLNLASLLASESLSGGASLQQMILAMNEYAMVSTLLG